MEKTDNFKKRINDVKSKALEWKDKAFRFAKGTVEKIKEDKKKRIIATIIITAVILFFGIGTVLYYIAGPSVGYMTSDSTDSLEWAEEYRITGELISTEYNYAAVLPFGGNQIFLPFLAMFGYSVAAQIGGLILFAILFCAALVYLGRGIGLGWFSSAGLATSVMLLMSSSAKLREIMWEHIFYYNLGILFFCFGFGLVLHILRDCDKISTSKSALVMTSIRLGILMIFCAISATDGLQALICLALPVLVGLAMGCLLDKEAPVISHKNLWIGVLILEIGVFTLIGHMLTGSVTNDIVANYAESYSSYGNINDIVNNFFKQIPNWFTLFGVSYQHGDPLLSKESIGNIIRIFVATVLFIVPIIQLIRYRQIESKPFKMVLLGHTAVMVFILFACSFGVIGNVNWRLTPMLGTCTIVTFLSVLEFVKSKGLIKRIGAVLAACVLLGCFMSYNKIWDMPADYGENNSWHVVASELEKRDLKYGYATFWWANLTKMIAGNGTQVANIGINNNGFIYEDHYQVRKDAYEDKDTDRYFVIFSEPEYPRVKNWIFFQKSEGAFVEEIVLESDEYDFRGIKGTKTYIIVLNQNPF